MRVIAQALAALSLLAWLSALDAGAQGWDTKVTAGQGTVPALEMTPLPALPKRPIPARQAQRLLERSLDLPTAALPTPAPKPPIWTTATTGSQAALEPAAAATLPKPSEAQSPKSNFVRQFCVNVADEAADARYAWQKKSLAELEQELEKRMALLEEKAAEMRKWLARRDEFSKKAREGLVLIYARMRPDAAAAQLVAMDEETAAAVLNRLDPRNASLIMSEMDPAHAARLTGIIAGAARVAPTGSIKADPREKRS
jgi:flagellar motility protein MotE (MotC chaperone)